MALHALRRGRQAKGLGERLRWRITAWRLGNYERQLVARAQASVFVSPTDAACTANNGNRSRVHVIPNGVDFDYFAPGSSAQPESVEPTVLFTGHLSFEPNREAALALVDEVLPRIRASVPNAVCTIVGADPPTELMRRHDGRRVFVTGRVADLRPYFDKAWVYVCPMRLGAGIKNKLLEAMAMEKAIVTTPRAVEGLPVRENEHLLLANDYPGMASRAVELLRNRERRGSLGRQARWLVSERYRWGTASLAYEQLYERLRSRQARTPAEVTR